MPLWQDAARGVAATAGLAATGAGRLGGGSNWADAADESASTAASVAITARTLDEAVGIAVTG